MVRIPWVSTTLIFVVWTKTAEVMVTVIDVRVIVKVTGSETVNLTVGLTKEMTWTVVATNVRVVLEKL